MKKLLLIPLISILFACSTNNTMSVNEPLTYDVKIKDNAEFILVKEGTSVEDFTNELPSYIDIETNADSYKIDWVGEQYSSLNVKEYEEKKNIYPLENSREDTLNHDSFRPIGIYVSFEKEGEITTDYKQIILAVARDDEYNIISSNEIKTIEEAYRAINEAKPFEMNGNYNDFFTLYKTWEEEQYVSNIRQK